MISRRRVVFLCLLVTLSVVVCEETHPGLVSSEQDLVAEASQTVNTAQKREAGLSNSYGEPLPPDAYGPPKDLSNGIPDLSLPPPVYGVPDRSTFPEQPPGAYGPPAPVNFPSQVYHGPPPPFSKPKPTYGPPKVYGPPKPVYGPSKLSQPKPTYGPPKKQYGPPKHSLPKPIYGVPFKPPKVSLSKPLFSPQKPIYGPPKPTSFYSPPKLNYGPPLPTIQGPISPPPEPILELPTLSLPPLENNLDGGSNLPAPIYGTPLVSLPIDLKPEFPLPTDSYGPPGQVIGTPIGPTEQVVFGNIGGFGHYGPPQPDPDPRPPHPGIPAPPTPPHVLYDGWKPIPGLSYPLNQDIGNELNLDLNLDQSLPSSNQHNKFSSSHITTGYANVHQDALSNIDLNAIVGGDSNGIDQSKTVFEAHYTEKPTNKPESDLSVVQGIGDKPLDTYAAPPFDSFSAGGPYPTSFRQQGAKGLVSSSGFYGVSVGNQYVAPNRHHHHNLPLSYGQHSGGGHSGFSSPHKPIKFRDSVPEGLLENLGQLTQHKDVHVIDHIHPGPTYLPPPIGDAKDFHSHSGNSDANSVSLSIEPTNLYSLPHSGNPITFHHPQSPTPSSLYGSPIDSYAAPLLTVGSDHISSGSHTNAITSTIDGTLLSNLSNLDAAAILKHCPYHEAILKAAKSGEKIPTDLATSYVNSLSSLGSTLGKSPHPISGSHSFTKDLITSHSKIHPVSEFKTEKRESYFQKGKSYNGKHIRDDRLQFVSDQIQKTSDRIRDLNHEAKELHQKIAATNHKLNTEVPIPSQIGPYSVQIQGSNSQRGKDSIPHEQLLSEGLLQSILQAIEDPVKGLPQNAHYQPYPKQQLLHTHIHQQSLPSSQSNYQNFSPTADNFPGIVLPEGYEPKDRSKDQIVQASTNSEVQHENANPCETDSKTSGSQKNEVVVEPPEPPKTEETTVKGDNDVAIFFDKNTSTEESTATSISEEESSGKDKS